MSIEQMYTQEMEVAGFQEMLAHVLAVTGPVEVAREALAERFPKGTQIAVAKLDEDTFEFSLVVPDAEQ